MKERLSKKFEESKRRKVNSKSIGGIIFLGYNYNDSGKKHSSKCWGLKPMIYYYCREPGHFVKDYPLIRIDRRSQLIESSGANERKKMMQITSR